MSLDGALLLVDEKFVLVFGYAAVGLGFEACGLSVAAAARFCCAYISAAILANSLVLVLTQDRS